MIDKTIPFAINTFNNEGNLYIKDIYNVFDYQPIIFTCSTNKGLYICLCYNGENNYILNKVTNDEVNKLLNKEITIYDIFTINHMFGKNKIIAIKPYCDVSAYCYLTTFKDIENKLPPKDLFLKRDVFDNKI